MSFETKDSQRRVDYPLWTPAPEPSKSSRFMTLSALVHAGLILAAGMIAAPLTEPIQTETVSIELEEPLRPLAQGIETTPTQGSVAAQPEVKEEPAPVTSEDIVVPAQAAARPPVEAVPEIEKPKIAKAAKAELKKATPTKSAPTKAVAVATPTKVGPPAAVKLATIDDIDAPEVDAASEEARQSLTPTAYNADLDKDLEDVNSQQAQVIDQEKNKIAQEADAVDAANEAALKEADEQNKAEVAALAKAHAERRAHEEQAIQQAAAQENAARAAAVKKAAALAAANAAAQTLAEEGAGAGNQGSNEKAPLAGTSDGVRSLDQLRQMPGNPIPQYSNRERLEGQNGQVTYHAYVRKDGTLTNFRQVNSTGFNNLDSKTLTALQQWRFYPGQEGWVELPFQWDLKGGAQSVDGLLRTKRSDLTDR